MAIQPQNNMFGVGREIFEAGKRKNFNSQHILLQKDFIKYFTNAAVREGENMQMQFQIYLI